MCKGLLAFYLWDDMLAAIRELIAYKRMEQRHWPGVAIGVFCVVLKVPGLNRTQMCL